jgi:hypothetical protein
MTWNPISGRKARARSFVRQWALPVAAALMTLSSVVNAAGVSARFDLKAGLTASPFPTDRFTQVDWTQNTLKRVNLPKTNCPVNKSDCADIDVINELDGFNTQPRITVPFTGNINVATVNSATIYLVNLGDVLSHAGAGQRIGINQVVWDPASTTLSFQSNDLLADHSRYALVVTNGVRDFAGDPITAGAFGSFRTDPAVNANAELSAYRKTLLDAQNSAGVPASRIVALSVFTTQSTTADLEKIRNVIKRATPGKIDFQIGDANGTRVRALFAPADLGNIRFNRQVSARVTGLDSFKYTLLPLPVLDLVSRNAVGRIAYGRFVSPNYLSASGNHIPATSTLTGAPAVQGLNALVVQMFLPSSPRPAGGYPVAIFGHGFVDSMFGPEQGPTDGGTPAVGAWSVVSSLAAKGIAVVTINVPGHGGGPASTLAVFPKSGGQVVVPAGGRSFDQNGDGRIESNEGVDAAAPRSILSNRDGLRQHVVDLMQLVRQIETGVDVTGDGTVDLNPSRIYYFGQSFGGIYGTMLHALDLSVKASVLNVAGGSITDVARLGGFRYLLDKYLAGRTPSLVNNVPTAGAINENIPLRNQPPVINVVNGAMALQTALDRSVWTQQSGNPASYAAALRRLPFAQTPVRPVIFQYAHGDKIVPNPTTTAIVRAGGLSDRVTVFRNDIAAANKLGISTLGHGFLTDLGNPQTPAATLLMALAAQNQIAIFFSSNGAQTIDPDGTGPYFETPVQGPLPEVLNFIP